jgi:hypothetical protein
LRKYLVAGLAALTAIGGATAALAQTSTGGSLTVKLSPTKAGTKKRPTGTKIHLVFNNNDHALTATQITILLPKQLTMATKGFKFCSQAKIEGSAGKSCPAKSKVGKGTSDAIAGVNNPATAAKLTFDVQAFLMSKKKVGFYLTQQGIPSGIKVTAVGTLGKASGKFGQKLVVAIPQIAKEFPAGSFNGLVKLDTTLGAKSGKRNLLGITACPKNKKLPFSTTVKFEPNPSPPPTPSVTASATAKCKK